MKLLDLDPDGLSLEFSTAEWPAVLDRLGLHGDVEREQHATFDVLGVAGEKFIYANDWDEPCLISSSPSGNSILRKIAEVEGQRLAS